VSAAGRRFLFVSLLAGALALGGCGEDDESGASADAPAATTSDPSQAPEEPAGPSEREIRRTGALTLFRTPDGNIGCGASPVSVRCDVREHEWAAPPPAEPCSLDYGNGIAVGEAGEAAFTCASDTVLDPEAPVLEKGEFVRLLSYRCEYDGDAMRCENERSRRGFTVSRERVEAF
jgi:hypothetical protein